MDSKQWAKTININFMRSNLFIEYAWDHLFMSATFNEQMELITEKLMGIFSINVFSTVYVLNLKKASFTFDFQIFYANTIQLDACC